METSGNKPLARFGHTAVSKGHRMYIFGGCAHKRPLLNDLYILDLKTMMFERVETGSHLPSARTWHAAVVVRNQMYVFGGEGEHDTGLNDL